MSWFSEKARELINNSRSAESNALYVKPGSTGSPSERASTFTRPSYAPGVFEPYTQPVTNRVTGEIIDQEVTPRGTDWWSQQLAAKQQWRSPYRYPMPPPQVAPNPVTYDADDPRFKPHWEARDDGGNVLDGFAHDSLRAMPRDATAETQPVELLPWEDPLYRRVKADDAGQNAKVEFGKLSSWEKAAWKNAADALGGGARTDQSTFALYLAKSEDAAREGDILTPLDFLAIEVGEGYLPEDIFSGVDNSESSGGGGYSGGGGFGGGGGGGAQIDLMNEWDARAVVNTLASQMLGRTVNEKEFKKYFATLKELQTENPQTVEFGDDGSTTVNQSIGADGLRYALEEDMRETEDFATNAIGTQALGLLEGYLAARRI